MADRTRRLTSVGHRDDPRLHRIQTRIQRYHPSNFKAQCGSQPFQRTFIHHDQNVTYKNSNHDPPKSQFSNA